MPLPTEWTRYLDSAYAQNRYSNFGPVHDEFQRRLTDSLCPAGRQAVLTSSGTAAITAALLTLDIRGRVLIPSFTFPATLQAVRQAGCQAIFCDVSESTWECGVEQVEPVLESSEVGAVIAVRPFGLCRDLARLEELCISRNIPLIVDSAAALGGELPTGERVGAQGTFEAFSLHATKVLGVGEGGVLMADQRWLPRIREVLNFGLGSERIGRGFNGKMNEFNSAVGLAVLDKFQEFVKRRRAAAAGYFDLLNRYPRLGGARGPGSPPWQAFPIRMPEDVDVADFVARAFDAGLELRRYYRPALHNALKDQAEHSLSYPVAARLADTIICWPIYSDASSEEIDEIVRISTRIFDGLNLTTESDK
jgi:dTDP-4-amino-4,6-dideoxygalactose transaminase